MKFLSGSLPSIFARSAAIFVMAFALLSIGFEATYASTDTTTSRTATTSPTRSLKNSKTVLLTAGPRSGLSRLFAAPPDRYTSITGSEILRLSPTDRRSGFSSAGPIEFRSSSSASSTISSSASSAATQANRSETSSLNATSRTVLLFSAGSLQRSLKIFGPLPEQSSRTSPIGRQKPLFRPPFSVSETGLTSAAFTRRRSISPVLWRLSMRERHRYARNSTASSSAWQWRSRRSRSWASWNPANLPRSSTNQRSGRLFPESL